MSSFRDRVTKTGLFSRQVALGVIGVSPLDVAIRSRLSLAIFVDVDGWKGTVEETSPKRLPVGRPSSSPNAANPSSFDLLLGDCLLIVLERALFVAIRRWGVPRTPLTLLSVPVV